MLQDEEQSFTTKHHAKTILVVEDDADNRELYTEAFALLTPHHVQVVRNGPEAGFHATAFACASRCRMLVPCTRNKRARPSGKRGRSWACTGYLDHPFEKKAL